MPGRAMVCVREKEKRTEKRTEKRSERSEKENQSAKAGEQ
jgi:hypothetical protein